MKKLLLSLGLAVGAFFSMSADTAEVTFSQLGYSNAEKVSLIEVQPITLKPEQKSSSTAPTYYSTGGLRIYKNGSLTISVPEGHTLTDIVFTASENTYSVQGSVNTGTFSTSGVTSTWTGSAQSVVLTVTTTKHCRIEKIAFTYTAPATAVDKVVMSSEVVGAEATVTLSCPTDGATIYYGFAQDAITNVYSAPFKVTESGIVYAFAQVGEDKSAVTQLSIDLPYTKFKDVIDNASNKEKVDIVGNFAVLYQNGNYLMLTDGISNILVYGDVKTTYEAGTKFSAISATVSVYSNLFELSATDAVLTEGGDGAEYIPAELLVLDGLNYNDNLFDEVILKGCTISNKNGKSATISINDEKVTMYNQFGLDFENGENYIITGFVWRNKDELQICPVSITGGTFVETVETPVIAPNHRELMPGDDITITCETEDAQIYYTIDGTEPSKDSTPFNEGDVIDFPEDVMDFTVKAIAYYEGTGAEMLPSEIAERTYHIFDPSCNILTTDSHDGKATYTAHTCTIDRVDYQMVGLHGNQSGTPVIQMNNSSTRFCYIIQTSDNKGWVVGDGIEWFLKSIEVEYNSNTNGITFAVRGSNTPFTADMTNMADEGNIKTNGDFIGTISSTNKSVEFTKNYRYFAFYPSKNGAVYLDAITVNYRSAENSPKQTLTGAYLEAEESVIQEQFEIGLKAFNSEDNEIDFTAETTITVTDAAGNKLTEGSDGFIAVTEGYEAYMEIKNAGVYTVTMSWTGDLNYEDGSLSTELTVFSPVSIANQSEGVVYSCSATFQDGSEETNGIPAFIFAEGARDHKIQLTAPAGAKLHYLAKEVSLSSPANAPKRVAGQDVPKGFTEHAGGEITLPGEHGIMQLVTEKNGVVSPVESAYYTNDADKLKEVTTGVAEVEIDNGIATYYDLQGRRVAADELKAGIYVRVAGKTVTKVLVK